MWSYELRDIIQIYFDFLDCPLGHFGVNCDDECHCKDVTEACNPLTGSCPSGCDRHWTGPGCQGIAEYLLSVICNNCAQMAQVSLDLLVHKFVGV